MESRILAYTEALALDTFLQVLTPEQRILTCQYRAGHTNKVPTLVQKLQDWVRRNSWQPPAFRYEPETLELQWKDDKHQWQPLSTHPLFKAEVTGK
nr:MAG TPA: core-binding factor subunit beta [Caudoviricetes sp.]